MGIQPSTNVNTPAPAAGDQANAVISGVFTGTGQSKSFVCWGGFNLNIYGDGGPNGNWHATVELERSFDGGSTWQVMSTDRIGTQAVYSTQNKDVSCTFFEPEKGVAYRLNCTAWTSGNVNYRLSATGGAAQSLSISGGF